MFLKTFKSSEFSLCVFTVSPLSCVAVTGVGSVGPRLIGHDMKAQDRLRRALLSQIVIVNRRPLPTLRRVSVYCFTTHTRLL